MPKKTILKKGREISRILSPIISYRRAIIHLGVLSPKLSSGFLKGRAENH
jgi:hypothetical protein